MNHSPKNPRSPNPAVVGHRKGVVGWDYGGGLVISQAKREVSTGLSCTLEMPCFAVMMECVH